ncbi:chromosome partitioning protein ParB [Halomonas sp. I5-271120]|uniref:chromosome partitioning protein ParB n=1 Tax=Halomonas sp. I5-271120 TaxID=3061632 RepID=UPI0027154E7A|nr:chromosome partitioning protein ParB [Halomonas sp. I5-271120]
MAMPRSLDAIHRGKHGDLKKANQFSAYPSDIHELEGFNQRDYEGEKEKAHIRSLADAYHAGRFVPPITVQVIDGKIFVRDGHCRRLGMLLAESEGAKLGKQPLIEFSGDENDADALILTSNAGLKLNPVKRAATYYRMKNRGLDDAEVAEKVGKTVHHVRQQLDLHMMPLEIKDLIEREVVSYSFALQEYNEHGTAAVERLKHGVDLVLRAGKSKLTEKGMKEKVDGQAKKPKARRISKRVVTGMVSQVHSLSEKLGAVEQREDGSATIELSAEEVSELMALREKLPSEDSSPAAGEEAEPGE